MMRRCPECDNPLPGTASKCRGCGWGKGAGSDISQYSCPRICEAHGCFVDGGMIAGVWGSEAGRRDGAPRTSVCQYHQGAPTHQWQAITRNLRRMRVLIKVLDQLEELSVVDRAKIQPAQVDDFSVQAGETIFSWIARARAMVRARSHKDLPEQASMPKISAGPMTMGQIIQSVKRSIIDEPAL